jgi:hypothetical protein
MKKLSSEKVKQALPLSRCGKYAPIGSTVAQILSTTQFVWLLQALGMLVECSYSERYTADNYWESLEGAWYTLDFLIHTQKSEMRGKIS